MTGTVWLAGHDLARAPSRTLMRIVLLALSVALVASMLFFIARSLRTMTTGAARSVPVAWQGPVDSLASARTVAASASRQAGVRAALPVATAPILGAEHDGPAGVVRTGAGAILAVPPGYASAFPTVRLLHGGFRPGEVVLDQQFAATLQAGIGDVVTLTTTRGARPERFTVSGVALVATPDVVFAPLDPRAGPAPAQPPAEIALLPLDTFAARIAPHLRSLTPAALDTNAVPGGQNGIQWQVDAAVDPRALHGDPSAALRQATRLRNRVERTTPIPTQFVDNLGAALTGAAQDALYAEALYILLALPGALVALALAYLAALGTADADRARLALLRTRGATRRHLIALAAAESALLGIAAGLLGAVGALLTVRLLVAGSVTVSGPQAVTIAATCIALATAGSFAARLAASQGVLRGSVSDARSGIIRTRPPLWQRLWLDVIALATSGLVYWLTLRTGFAAIVNPDANPTLSLSAYMFLAPALCWVGVALLLLRLRGRAMHVLARAAGGGSTLRTFLLASAGRRGAAVNRGLLVVSLLLAFAVQLAVFSATYAYQAGVDAQLTIGADVTVTAAPGAAAALQPRIAQVPGVAATTAVDHAYGYVGPDLQDLYGIEPGRFTAATTLRDSYFLGASATATMHALAARPDGLLVSRETITDYSLALGDLVRLRVLDQATGRFVTAPFHVTGIVQEFPSAPKDSFMVANLAYVQRVTHGTGPNVLLVKTSRDPATVGRLAAAAVPGAAVTTIREQTQRTTSSITTVDLTAISRIEQAFAVLLVAAAVALYLQLALAERRREFATMAAFGTPVREIAAFLWSEALLIVASGAALAIGLGLLLATMLTAMLTHVFDPPPDHLTIPWGYLAVLGGSAVAGAAIAMLLALRTLRRLPLGVILRDAA